MAVKMGKTNVVYDISKSIAKKIKQEDTASMRPHTVLRSRQSHVDIRPQMDSDKNYFLNEFLKLLAFSENYYKHK